MGDKHITVENADGASPTSRWHTTETYKVSDSVAAQFAAMKQQLTGRDAKDWLRDHGAVLDDGNGKAAKISTKNTGAQLIDHYEDGKLTTTDYVKPKGKGKDKDHDHAGAELLLALFTGGASLFIPHDIHAGEDKKPSGSKFGTTSSQTATAESSGEPASKETKPATSASTGKRPKTP